LQAVFIARIEVLAVITYVNSVGWFNQHFNMLNRAGEKAGLLNGLGLAGGGCSDVAVHDDKSGGREVLIDSNVIIVIWKTLVPILAIVVVARLQFNSSNFHAGADSCRLDFTGLRRADRRSRLRLAGL
jgi:hypothetical protein